MTLRWPKGMQKAIQISCSTLHCRSSFILMHDNVRSHKTYACEKYAWNRNTRAYGVPACFPGLNLIKHVWDIQILYYSKTNVSIDSLELEVWIHWTVNGTKFSSFVDNFITPLENRCEKPYLFKGSKTRLKILISLQKLLSFSHLQLCLQ